MQFEIIESGELDVDIIEDAKKFLRCSHIQKLSSIFSASATDTPVTYRPVGL